MKIARDTLSLALFASGLVGIQILLTDGWLWSAAPSHAFGLAGFVVIDMLLLLVTLMKINLAALGAIVISTLQLGAMLADIVAGQPGGVPSVAFRNYLITDTSYLGLLLIQVAIASVGIATLAVSLLRKHHRWYTFRHQHFR